ATTGMNFQNLIVTPDNANPSLLNLIDNAQTRLYVYNQELYDPTLVDHLIAAKQRGVDVHVLAAGSGGAPTDDDPMCGATNKKNIDNIQKLVAAGIKAEQFNTNYLHAKAIIADDKVFIGSQNFSSGGLVNNRELGEIINDQTVVQQMVDTFLR